MAGRMLVIPIRRKTFGDVESGGAARNHVEQRRGGDGAGHLRDDIGQDLSSWKAAAGRKAHRNGGIEMASGDMADGIGHRDDAQSECQRHTDQTDPDLWKRRRDHRAAATCKSQPKRTDPFGSIFLRIHIVIPPSGERFPSKATPNTSNISSPSPAEVKL